MLVSPPRSFLGHWIGWCTAFQLYPGPLSAGGDVHVHGLRASVPLKTSKRVCSSPPAWWLVDLLVQCSAYFGCAELPSYWVVNHLAFLHLQKFFALFFALSSCSIWNGRTPLGNSSLWQALGFCTGWSTKLGCRPSKLVDSLARGIHVDPVLQGRRRKRLWSGGNKTKKRKFLLVHGLCLWWRAGCWFSAAQRWWA